jgi:hypothetical protein
LLSFFNSVVLRTYLHCHCRNNKKKSKHHTIDQKKEAQWDETKADKTPLISPAIISSLTVAVIECLSLFSAALCASATMGRGSYIVYPEARFRG